MKNDFILEENKIYILRYEADSVMLETHKIELNSS